MIGRLLASRHWRLATAIGLVLAVATGVVLRLGIEVERELDRLATARSDNVFWTLAQAEVELRALEAATLRRLHGPAGDLDMVRRRFDIFYSRVATFAEGDLYRNHRADAEFAAALDRLTGFTKGSVPLIDGPDAALASALPGFAEEIASLLAAARRLALVGIDIAIRLDEAQRKAVSGTLVRLEALAGALFLALAVLALWLYRLSRINARRAAEIAAAAERLRAVFASSLDAIIVADTGGTVRAFNAAAERMFGYAREEAIGARVEDLMIPEEMVAAHRAGMARYRESGARKVVGAGVVQLKARRRDGTSFPAEISIQPARDDSGEILVSFIHDATKRKAAEEALVEARDRALAGEKAKARFLAVMSHEMRTPLNGLLGTLALMAEEGIAPRQRRHVDNMETSGRLLQGLVNDVLDITRLDIDRIVPERAPFVPERLLEEVVASQRAAAEARGNSLDHDWLDTPPEALLGDAGRLRQILLNLIGNAVKFTRDGAISVEAEILEQGPEACRIEFRVADTGIGIPEDALERIFEDFWAADTSYGRSAEGTGLGLGIARRLVAAMGGEIGAESEEGEGSLFWVRLPFARAAGSPVAPATTRPEPARPLDILVVEDNRINREVARGLLEAAGHRVSEACDGREGVTAAESRRFDLVLMDISMPVMDGMQATAAIRSGAGPSRDARILALTAHVLPDEIAAFRDAGMDGHLPKPFDRAALARALAPEAPEGVPRDAAPGPLIDAGHLDSLAEDLGRARIAALVSRYLAETGAEMDAIGARIEAGEGPTQEMLERIHKLAGSSGTIGARRLHGALSAAETKGRRGDRAGFEDGARAALAVWEETLPALEARSAMPAAPGG